MVPKKNRLDFESNETKEKYIKEVIGFFLKERDQEIGYIAAEEILDFFLQSLGEEIYRKAVKDCKKLLRERHEDLEVELEVLTPSRL